MINSAIRSDPASIRANPEPPPADGHAGLSATAAPAPAGPLCSCINLPAAVGQVAEARRFVASVVDDPTLVDDAVLCVSELAANAVLHSNSRLAGGRFTVAAERYSDGRLRIMVLDQGGRWAERARVGHEPLGLMIVSRIASTWGIDSNGPHGRTVWFELRPAPILATPVP